MNRILSFILYLPLYLFLLNCSHNSISNLTPENVAIKWMKASINGNKDTLDKYTNWEKKIDLEKQKDKKTFETEKGSILELHAFWADVIAEEGIDTIMLSSLRVAYSKMHDSLSEVGLKLYGGEDTVSVTLKLIRKSGSWKVYEDK